MKKRVWGFVVGLVLFIVCSGMSFAAEGEKLSWTNDPALENGILINGVLQKLTTVIEVQKKGATAWSEYVVVPDGASITPLVIPQAYVAGETLVFRAKARIIGYLDTNGTVGPVESGYSNTVEYKVPFVVTPSPVAPALKIVFDGTMLNLTLSASQVKVFP